MVKLTAELIEQAAQYTNAVRDRELDLRGETRGGLERVRLGLHRPQGRGERSLVRGLPELSRPEAGGSGSRPEGACRRGEESLPLT